MNTIRVWRRGTEVVAWLSRADASVAAKAIQVPEGNRLKVGVFPATERHPECYVLVESITRAVHDAEGRVEGLFSEAQQARVRKDVPLYRRLAAWREDAGLSRREALRVLASSSPAELKALFSRYARVDAGRPTETV